MLVLGCMRSASSSVTDFLLSITGLPRHSVPMLPGKVKGYEGFPSSTIDYISKEMLTEWVCSKNYIIQEHLAPIPEHREILLSIPREQRKIIITKRNWEDSYISQMNRRSTTPDPEGCKKSFKMFREDLEVYFPEEDGYLHVEFETLINNEAETLSQVLEYLNISHSPKQLVLPKSRMNGG